MWVEKSHGSRHMTGFRLKRIATSLAVVLAAYWAYALFVVRWIEPPAAASLRRTAADAAGGSMLISRGGIEDSLRALFPDDAWERSNPKVLSSGQMTLLFRDYHMLDNGRIQLEPCTLVLDRSAHAGEADNSRSRPTILQAPAGAILEFDRLLDLRRAKVGRLMSGRLPGPITILRQESEPGAGDDLHLETRNVMLSRQRVWTPERVDLRYGGSFGSGRDLVIELAPDNTGTHTASSTAATGRLRSVELVRVDRFHLQPPKGGLLTKDFPVTDGADSADQNTPIEITCRGPFRFDAERQLASFEDQVDVVRVHSNGESEQLSCRLLEIHFTGQEPDSSSEEAIETKVGSDQGRKMGVKPTRIVAVGHPVIVRSPTYHIQARGQRLEYDLLTRRFSIEDGNDIMLRYGDFELETSKMIYELAEPGRLGRLWAAGPGRFGGVLPSPGARRFEAHWANELLMRLDGSEHVISLVEDAWLNIADTGTIGAGAIHLWLNQESEVPADSETATTEIRVYPGRLLAEGDVQWKSTQLTGSTPSLAVWFPPQMSVAPHKPSDLSDESNPDRHSRQRNLRGGRVGQPSTRPNLTQHSQASQSRFHLAGDSIRIQLVHNGDSIGAEDITVDGKVYLSETQTATPGDLPLMVTGTKLRVQNASLPSAAIRISGEPSNVQARGLNMTGAEIQMNRASNRIWMNGPGWMTLPVDRESDGRPAQKSSSLAVAWKGRMDFDGSLIQYEKSVTVLRDTQQITADSIQVALSQRVDFNRTTAPTEVKPRRIDFHGIVRARNESVEMGQLSSRDFMQVRELSVDLQTGQLAAAGPGWIRSVRQGAPQGFSDMSGLISQRKATTPSADMTFMRIDYQKGIAGNVYTRQLQFYDNVVAIFGPVSDWDQQLDVNSPGGLGEREVQLNCDTLAVMQTPANGLSPSAMHFNAIGNTLVEGNAFNARAHRLSYSADKDLLVLEGTGRSKAELWHRQDNRGAYMKSQARKIQYHPRTGEIDAHMDFIGVETPGR